MAIFFAFLFFNSFHESFSKNILLVIADDLGNSKCPMPNLNKLKSQGTTFTNAYATVSCF